MDVRALRRAFDQEDILWTFYLTRPLEERQKGLSVEWVIRCVARLLPESGSPHFAQLEIDLADLTAWFHDTPTSVPYRPERGREIWDYPGRENGGAHRAMSNLYAVYYWYKNDKSIQDSGTPIMNIFWDTLWAQRPDDLFQIIIEVYQQLMSETDSSSL